jgi:hypothetical protein
MKFLTTSLSSISISATSPAPQSTLFSSRATLPYLYSILLRLAKTLDELRQFYALKLRRKPEGKEGTHDSGNTCRPLPNDLLPLLEVAMVSLVEIVCKGLAFDAVLSKLVRCEIEESC